MWTAEYLNILLETQTYSSNILEKYSNCSIYLFYSIILSNDSIYNSQSTRKMYNRYFLDHLKFELCIDLG